MSTTTRGVPMPPEEPTTKDDDVVESDDAWRVTRRDVVDQRQVLLPPIVVERERQDGRVPGGAGVMAIESERRALGRLVAAIDAAQRLVVAGAFLIASPEIERALLAAARRGVRVYVLVAAEARLLKEPKLDSEFDRRVFEEHMQMLDRLAGWAMIRTAGDWHAKIVLVDDGPTGAGFLLTANLTTEALARNEELVVALTERERDQVREVVRWVLWVAAQHEVVEPGKLRSVSPIADVIKPGLAGPIVTTLQGRGSLQQAMLDVIARARGELIVASFGWSASHPVVTALIERARAGVEVTVLARARPASMPALVALAQAGAQVRLFRWLHAKAVWCDARLAVVATANLEPQGLDLGIELGVVLDDVRVGELEGVLRGWAARAGQALRVGARLGEVRGTIGLWRDGKIEEERVQDSVEVREAETRAPSADRLDLGALPPANTSELPHPLAHERVVIRAVVAPDLDPRSRPAKGDGASRPALFREPGGRLVVVVNDRGQLTAAQELSAANGRAPIVVERRRS